MLVDATVYVIDDDPRVLRAVDRLLRSCEYRSQTYTSAKEFLLHEMPPGPACIVLDLSMPEMNGLDLQQILAQGDEELPIIFISGHGDIPASVRAMKAGAVDFLTKPFEDRQLLTAIEAALSRSSNTIAARAALKKDITAFEGLSQRERQVCLGVTQGLLNKQICGELGTTEKTVKVQRGQVMKKLGAGSVADLVKLVERLRAAGRLPHVTLHP